MILKQITADHEFLLSKYIRSKNSKQHLRLSGTSSLGNTCRLNNLESPVARGYFDIVPCLDMGKSQFFQMS